MLIKSLLIPMTIDNILHVSNANRVANMLLLRLHASKKQNKNKVTKRNGVKVGVETLVLQFN